MLLIGAFVGIPFVINDRMTSNLPLVATHALAAAAEAIVADDFAGCGLTVINSWEVPYSAIAFRSPPVSSGICRT